jgi:hypothetical protein
MAYQFWWVTWGPVVSRKLPLGIRICQVNRSIARHLHKGAPVPGLAQALADLLRKEQRNRLGQLQNMRKRGELC